MELSHRKLIKIAGSIRDRLLAARQGRRHEVRRTLGSLTEAIQRLEGIRRKLIHCEANEWHAAGAKIMRQIGTAYLNVPYCMQQVEQAVHACTLEAPSVSEIFRDLRQAEREFGQVAYCEEGDLLSVATDPIQLEDIYLGGFEIQLHVPSLDTVGRGETYRVVALDPHPAATNNSVTHPHVSDEGLCAGDAGAAISAALISGRVCDFFMLVRSVLMHYNPDSPFVSLANWEGTLCDDCGYARRSNDMYGCDACTDLFCEECISYCRRCDRSYCRGCLRTCPACDDPVCESCMTSCASCGEPLCTNCLEEEQCPCNEESKENQDEEDPQETTIATSNTDGDHNGIDVVRQAARATATAAGTDAA